MDLSSSTILRRCAVVSLVSIGALVACRGEQIENPVAPDTGSDTADDTGAKDGADPGGDTASDAASDGSVVSEAASDAVAEDTGAEVSADTAADAPASEVFVGGPKNQADCPIARGPKMKFLAAPEPFCIDETEVTDAQFNAFILASDKPKAPEIPAFCGEQLKTLRALEYSTTYAAVKVRWCDAYAYCRWAGKRLCGKHGGGAYSSEDSEASATSQWSYACRGGIPGYMYPYETSSWVSGKCIDDASGVATVQPVDASTWSGCHGSGEFSTLMHMAGNAREWEDACDAPIGASTSCRTRGGAFNSPWNQANCGSLPRLNTNADATTGFRCCFDGR